MKKILITGAGSYIGVNVENYLLQWPEEYQVDTLDMTSDEWNYEDFSKFDVVFHVAGIAHIKETKKNAHLYYEVNEYLAIAVAEKAKKSGVKQFIILSTMSVYGRSTGHITKETKPNPVMNYGKAKLNADLEIEKMSCSSFKVAVLRPPMVYGKGCKGNFQTLRKFALKSKVFPSFRNKRSMLFIGNLSAFVKSLIDKEMSGLFFPQDAEYISTADIVKRISELNGNKIFITSLLNWGVWLMISLKLEIFRKVFGNLTYEKVDVVMDKSFDEAMEMTEF